MECINYFFEDIPEDLKLKDPQFSIWINTIVESYNQRIAAINYIYCSDNYLLQVNTTYLNHDYYTDIITFDNREKTIDPLEADIFISLDRVRENANIQATPFTDELNRVMIHGVLHLLGQGDKSIQERDEMRKKEEASLSLRKF